MRVVSLDHLVLTVCEIEATAAFYCNVLGMEREVFQPADSSTRVALKFGRQKINLHQAGAEFEPKSAQPTSGSADLCFLTEAPLADWPTGRSISRRMGSLSSRARLSAQVRQGRSNRCMSVTRMAI